MVLASSGEDAVFRCPECGYGANAEKAVAGLTGPSSAAEKERPMERVHTPGAHTVDDVAVLLSVAPQKIIKTLIYETDREFAAVLIRGDLEVNEIKLKNALGAAHLALASAAKIEQVTGGPLGFSGPVGLKGVRILADTSIAGLANAVTGANAADYHLVGVNAGRDFSADAVLDLRAVGDGDPCGKCGRPLAMFRGIEVGHIFQLGTKYSEPMKCLYLDDHGIQHPMRMGCYGLGMGRTIAAAIEQNHDDKGIIWPTPLAPYHVDIIATNPDDAAARAVAESLYASCLKHGIEAIYDDRAERAGVKFKDAELIGFPVQVVVGSRKVKEGKVEIGERKTGLRSDTEVSHALEKMVSLLS